MLAQAIAESPAFSIAGGGDTLAAIDKFGVGEQISYISTGGGAFLEFVEGKVLPAVEVLEQRANNPSRPVYGDCPLPEVEGKANRRTTMLKQASCTLALAALLGGCQSAAERRVDPLGSTARPKCCGVLPTPMVSVDLRLGGDDIVHRLVQEPSGPVRCTAMVCWPSTPRARKAWCTGWPTTT